MPTGPQRHARRLPPTPATDDYNDPPQQKSRVHCHCVRAPGSTEFATPTLEVRADRVCVGTEIMKLYHLVV